MSLPFQDREDAGRQLGAAISNQYRGREDVIVLGLARGGMPVAQQVAKILAAPLDVLVVRKLGLPGHEEFAMGAIGPGGIVILNEQVVNSMNVTRRDIDAVRNAEQMELEKREQRYRAGHPALELSGKTAILVDDGLATGSTMQAAVAVARKSDAARIIVAVPVAAAESCARLSPQVNEIICLFMPEVFRAVGQWYESFPQTSHDEVGEILDSSRGGFAYPLRPPTV